MSKYELDDEMVQKFVTAAPASGQGNGGVVAPLADALKAQIPIPAPVKIGAVVRTSEPNYTYTRWALDSISNTPWIDAADGEQRSTERLGRITEVLSPGVDL